IEGDGQDTLIDGLVDAGSERLRIDGGNGKTVDVLGDRIFNESLLLGDQGVLRRAPAGVAAELRRGSFHADPHRIPEGRNTVRDDPDLYFLSRRRQRGGLRPARRHAAVLLVLIIVTAGGQGESEDGEKDRDRKAGACARHGTPPERAGGPGATSS